MAHIVGMPLEALRLPVAAQVFQQVMPQQGIIQPRCPMVRLQMQAVRSRSLQAQSMAAGARGALAVFLAAEEHKPALALTQRHPAAEPTASVHLLKLATAKPVSP